MVHYEKVLIQVKELVHNCSNGKEWGDFAGIIIINNMQLMLQVA